MPPRPPPPHGGAARGCLGARVTIYCFFFLRGGGPAGNPTAGGPAGCGSGVTPAAALSDCARASTDRGPAARPLAAVRTVQWWRGRHPPPWRRPPRRGRYRRPQPPPSGCLAVAPPPPPRGRTRGSVPSRGRGRTWRPVTSLSLCDRAARWPTGPPPASPRPSPRRGRAGAGRTPHGQVFLAPWMVPERTLPESCTSQVQP